MSKSSFPDGPSAPDAASTSELHPTEALTPDEGADLIALLRAASAPAPLDPARHEALLAAALGGAAGDAPHSVVAAAGTEPPASIAEAEDAARLRAALAGEGTHPLAELAGALRCAATPGAAPEGVHERAWGRTRRPAGRVIRVAFGAAAAALAVAAGVALLAGPVAPRDTAGLVRSRSTGALFPEGFEGLSASERVDRVSAVRARELRDNRYHAWGVR